MSTQIDEALNTWLGLPSSYVIDKFEAFEIYSYFQSMLSTKVPVDSNRLEYYVDRKGDFVNKPKNKMDYVVKAIFDNMNSDDRFSVLDYINYWKQTKKFTDFSEYR